VSGDAKAKSCSAVLQAAVQRRRVVADAALRQLLEEEEATAGQRGANAGSSKKKKKTKGKSKGAPSAAATKVGTWHCLWFGVHSSQNNSSELVQINTLRNTIDCTSEARHTRGRVHLQAPEEEEAEERERDTVGRQEVDRTPSPLLGWDADSGEGAGDWVAVRARGKAAARASTVQHGGRGETRPTKADEGAPAAAVVAAARFTVSCPTLPTRVRCASFEALLVRDCSCS
jgi:hypothetical protein